MFHLPDGIVHGRRHVLCVLQGIVDDHGAPAEIVEGIAGSLAAAAVQQQESTHGHIAIATSNVDRAVYHLGLCGIRCLPETRKTDAKGNTKAIYIDGEFGGFAIHLVRR